MGAGELRVAVRRHGDGVGITIEAAEAALVDARKLLWRVVDHAPVDPAPRRIHRPALKPALRVKLARVGGEHRGVGDDVEDYPTVPAIERVGDVEGKAWFDVAPDRPVLIGVSRQQAHAGAVSRVPAEREPMATEHGAHREGDGQVENDREPCGQRAVVDAGTVLHRHWAGRGTTVPAGETTTWRTVSRTLPS